MELVLDWILNNAAPLVAVAIALFIPSPNKKILLFIKSIIEAMLKSKKK